MINGVKASGLGAIIMSCACGGGTPEVVTPPPLHITATPPKPAPQRARWVFSHPEEGLHAKFDLGDGRAVYAGNNGRREMAREGEPLVDASTLALGDLIAIRKTPDGHFAFIANDGTMYLAKDPMGALDVVRPGPVGEGKTFVDQDPGKVAMLGIHPDGRLLRTTDFGLTWKEVDYAGANKPYGRPTDLAMDSKGNGILLHMPQRLYVTHDDGATWAPIAPVHGMGARVAFHDGKDRIYVSGYGGAMAMLNGSTLVPTTERPEPIYKAPEKEADETAQDERGETKSVLVGDHVVEFTEINRHGKVRELKIGSAALGDKIEKRASNTELVGENGLSKHIAAFGKELVYLRDDDDADENAPTTTLYRSKDFGATWTKESQLQGVEAAYGDGVDVAAGPKGFVFVTSLCAKDERSGPTCARRQVRPVGGQFEDIAFTEDFEPKEFAFDEAHDKVFVLGTHDGRQHVYESPLSQNKFSRTKLLDASPYTKAMITVDGKGGARAFEWDYSKGWVLHRLGDDGKEAPPMYLALDRGNVAFIGARGLIFAGRDKGWETNDAGDSWTRVATNGYASSLVCSDAGCVNGDAARVGWELPALQGGDKVTAQAEPTKPPQVVTPPHPPAPPPQELTCKASGSASPISQTPSSDMVDGMATDRWATVKHDSDGKIGIIVGTKSAVRDLPLFAALPKPPAKPPANPEELRTGERVLNDGVVAARYRFAPRSTTGTYNPVDVELAWWSAVTGRTMHHTLPKVSPFRVSRYGFSGTPQIVDGGILFQGSQTDPAYFIHDDGKVETLTLPHGTSVGQAERLAKRWVLADTMSAMVQISESDDNAKTWKQTAWGLGWGSIGLVSIADKATVTFGSSGTHAMLFPIEAALADDPPAPVVIDESSVTTACDAKAGRHRFTGYIPSDARPIRVKIENTKGTDKWTTTLSPGNRVMHDAPGGRMCTSAYVLSGWDRGESQTMFVYPEANGAWSGWRFHRADKTGMVAEPMTCK
jgi:hypothetical protein